MQFSVVLATAFAVLVAAGPYEVSLYASASAFAEEQLASLSAHAATATGAEAASLTQAYESLKSEASSANAVAVGDATFSIPVSGYPTAPPGYPAPTGGYAAPTGGYGGDHGNGTSPSAPSAPLEQTGNGAAATAVPIAMGAVGIAVMGLL